MCQMIPLVFINDFNTTKNYFLEKAVNLLLKRKHKMANHMIGLFKRETNTFLNNMQALFLSDARFKVMEKPFIYTLYVCIFPRS